MTEAAERLPTPGAPPPISAAPGEGSLASWLAVTGGFMGLLLGAGFAIATFGVFLVAIEQAEGWSRTAISWAASANVAVYGLTSPFVGGWAARVGVRRLFLLGSVGLGLALLLVSQVQELWQLYAAYALVGFTTAFLGMVPVTQLVSGWFTVKRGVALGIAFAGVGFAGFVLTPLASGMLQDMTWRDVYWTLGLGIGLGMLVLSVATVRDGPGAQIGAGGSKSSMGDTFKIAVASRGFWLVAIAGALFFGLFIGVASFAKAIAIDRGMSDAAGTGIIALVVGMGAVGKILMGAIADRYEAKWVLAGTFTLQGVALLLAIVAGGGPLMWVFAILFGIGQGGSFTTPPLVLVKLFGTAIVGEMVGLYLVATVFGSIFGAPATGAIRDATGDWTVPLLCLAAAAFLGAVCASLIRYEKRASA